MMSVSERALAEHGAISPASHLETADFVTPQTSAISP
jgi:hypothetical protein